MFPPVDAVDGLVFGEVDLSRIRDNMNQILKENIRIGKELSFQAALTSVKYVLEAPDNKVGNIATIEFSSRLITRITLLIKLKLRRCLMNQN